MSHTNSILLTGLDGSNPLAFLAALGTLRTLTLALPDEPVKMSWEMNDGAWRPRVWCSAASAQEAMIDRLHPELEQAGARASFAIADNLNLPADEFRTHLISAVQNADSLSTPRARTDADFLAAFGSEVVTDKNGMIADTALRTMSGAGHQHFLKFFRELASNTDRAHVQRTLFSKWDYADDGRGLNLRWDPTDDRRYALRWDDPSGDPVKTMRGANRLAIEALPMFPVVPTSEGAATTAFRGSRSRDTFFIWPIWSGQLSMQVTKALLGQVGSLTESIPARCARGLTAMYSSARITTGKFRNFTPALPV